VYEYVYICIYTYLYIFIHTYIHIYMCMDVCAYTERMCTNKLPNMHVPIAHPCCIHGKIHDKHKVLKVAKKEEEGERRVERGGCVVGNLHLPRHSNTPVVRTRHK